MGASCVGKTTCPDVLAQRKHISVASSSIFVNGGPLCNEFARGTTYAERADVHEGTATVFEAIRFSAYLRQLCRVPKERVAYIEEVMEPLELQLFADATVFSSSSSFTRIMGPMICTELHGFRIQCKPDEFSGFNPPEGQTCGAWANEFVSALADISYEDRWRDGFALFAFFIFTFLLVIITITSRFLRFAKR